MKKIGKVSLDETYYPGEDLYSDGVVEDQILHLVETYSEEEYNRVIAQKKDWAVMYHLTHERANIISWYPFQKDSKVLEIGSGCGAITGELAKRVKSVTCIELSMKRSRINAARNQEKENIKVCVGNFQDIEKSLETDFDYATLIGVFEYGKGYIGGEKPYHEFLTTTMKHLKPGGKLLIAIENKFGLKYWAGCTEDHTGNFFEGLEGYQSTKGVRTFTKPEWISILEECGCRNYRFYYPYPDYKLPMVIFSDEHLPKRGELDRNICNFDRKRLLLMDEGKVFDQILADHLFPLYSNSFFIEVVKEVEEEENFQKQKKQVIYTKYSSGRALEFALQTRMIKEETGKLSLYKIAEYPKGQEHIKRIVKAREKLEEFWKENKLVQVNQCYLKDEKLFFEYLEGITLEEELDYLVEQGKLKQATEKIKSVLENIIHAVNIIKFQMTTEFQKVFGDNNRNSQSEFILQQELAVEIADVDLIFSNLLSTKDGTYQVLDYEWTFFFPVPVGYLIFRALHYYLDTSSKRISLKKQFDFYEYFGITKEKRQIYEVMEKNFQRYISGGYVSLAELYQTMGKGGLALDGLLGATEIRRMQVYLNCGQGFSEENSFFLESGYKQTINHTISIPEDAIGIWIDPALSACILKDMKLYWKREEEEVLPVKYTTTGFEIEKGCYLFDNSDPKIIIEEIPQGKRQIGISYNISILEEKTAILLMEKLNTREERMKRKVRGLIKG